MRIRFKPWARPELEASKYYIDNPEDFKGKWHSLFSNDNPIYVELGCGKGNFISKLAVNNTDINFIAIDLVDAMIGQARRNIESTYNEAEKEVENVILTRYDIERIFNIFDKTDSVKRIYINFCNPWPRGKHHKKRLTHTRQLEKYREFLQDGGEIYFKTDDDSLFSDSLTYFNQSGFEIIDKTYDLEHTPDFKKHNDRTWKNVYGARYQDKSTKGSKTANYWGKIKWNFDEFYCKR